jgi:glycosyltransferase involved in cell wall biosynthesis
MRIAQIAPLSESVPPQTYGGTERIVGYLCDALLASGHEVVLYASGDSRTGAELRSCCPRSLRNDPAPEDPVVVHRRMLRRVLDEAEQFDLLHFHTGWFEFPLFDAMRSKCMTTMHGRLDVPEVKAWLRRTPHFPLVSISYSQRAPLSPRNWLGNVYHGLPYDRVEHARASGDSYLAFLGRISPEKRPDRAIEIARRAGRRLKIAAKIDPADQTYFADTIRPLLAQPHVEFIGELGERDKLHFLAGADALLFPIDWPEPFGLVLIEAMACGTPVIAFRGGAVPEIIRDGRTGFVVDTLDQAVAALQQIETLDPAAIGAEFQLRFGAARMARDYVALYERLLSGATTSAVVQRRCASGSAVESL